MEIEKSQKIKITYTDENINPVDFREYSDFEFRWVETILTKVIKRSDILSLLRQFEIKFFEENWEENLPIAEMGNVLISDVPKKDLLPAVKEIMKKYPDKISFDKAKDIWKKLDKLSAKELFSKYPHMLKSKESAKNKNMALSLILDCIYKKPWYSQKEICDIMTAEEWKSELKQEQYKGEKSAQKTKDLVQKQWSNKQEWHAMMDKLEKLSLEELRN